MPPSSVQASAYWAPPSGIRRTSLVRTCWRNSAACGPQLSISPMCETSNTPARSRTAMCSSRMPPYWTGMSQPANGTSFAPSAAWRPCSGVRRSSAGGADMWREATGYPVGPMTRLCTALTVLAAVLAAAAPAHAGSYEVVACGAPGAGGVNHSWTPRYDSLNSATPDASPYYEFDDSCAGGLVVRSRTVDGTRAPWLTSASWAFDAPAGTQLTKVTTW